MSEEVFLELLRLNVETHQLQLDMFMEILERNKEQAESNS